MRVYLPSDRVVAEVRQLGGTAPERLVLEAVGSDIGSHQARLGIELALIGGRIDRATTNGTRELHSTSAGAGTPPPPPTQHPLPGFPGAINERSSK